MTKVQIRFRLEKPPDERMMEQIAAAHSIYGIMRVQTVLPALEEIVVDFDASRLKTADVGAALRRSGIQVELEK
jgi:hypothetical protein